MKRAGVLAVCCLVLASNAATAQTRTGADAPEIEAKEWLNIDDPISLADLNGMVVVLYFWVSFHDGGERMIGLVNAIENNPSLGRQRGVAVLGLTEADAKQIQATLDNEKVFFPIGVGSETHKKYRITRFPWVVIVDPKGKVAYSGVASKGDELVKKVRETLDKTPPTKTHPLEVPKVHKELTAARQGLQESSYRTAFRHARTAYETAITGDPLKTRCEDMLDLIEAIGMDQFADVDELVEKKDFEKAVTILRTVSRQFKGMDVSRSARRLLEQLSKDHTKVAELMKGEEKENEAQARLFTAQQLLKELKVGQAYDAMQQVVKEFAGTDSAQAAERIMARMKEHKPLMSMVRDHLAARECKPWLSQARSYIRNRRSKSKARQLLRQIISKYPDTTYADQAAEELAKLR